MKRIEIKVIRMPSGKYLSENAWSGEYVTEKTSEALKWYGTDEETDIEKIAQDWGGKIVVLREVRDETRD